MFCPTELSDSETEKRVGVSSPCRSKQLRLSEKIVPAMVVWLLSALILSLNSGTEVFLTLILIGVLIIRELVYSLAPIRLKKRVYLFICGLGGVRNHSHVTGVGDTGVI